MASCRNGQIIIRKNNGMVRDVFSAADLPELRGEMVIGHVRYPTAGCRSSQQAQPFYVNSPLGIALAHNGNLTNAVQLKEELFAIDWRHINTDSDSEVLAIWLSKSVAGASHKLNMGFFRIDWL